MANEMKERVKERVTETVETRLADQKTRAAGHVSAVAETLHSSSEDLRDRGEEQVGRYVERAADQVERIATYLQDTDVSEVVDRVEDFARREPAAFVAGAFAVGFLASRLLKSSREKNGDTDAYGQGYDTNLGEGGVASERTGRYEAGSNLDFARTSAPSRTTSQPEMDYDSKRGL